MIHAEVIALNVDTALKEALRAYDDSVWCYCLEDEDDTSNDDHFQDTTYGLVPQIEILGHVMGYDEEAMTTVLTLIKDYCRSQEFPNGCIEDSRLFEGERLRAWLYSDESSTPFCDLALTGVVSRLA